MGETAACWVKCGDPWKEKKGIHGNSKKGIDVLFLDLTHPVSRNWHPIQIKRKD